MKGNTETHNICIIGGGAAGFFAAIHCKQNAPEKMVIILEKAKTVLNKVKISGGGRCNVTHACFDIKKLVEHYPRGQKELLGPFYRFSTEDTLQWFESRGVKLKTEKDGRIFPVSNSSQSIIDCLSSEASRLGIKIWTGCAVQDIQKTTDAFSLQLSNGQSQNCEKLVLATGSAKQGYDFAQKLGHQIISPIPSLFSFKIADPALTELQGLSVAHCHCWLEKVPKAVQSGPILITHWGLSGPAIIKLSAWQAQILHKEAYKATLYINWLPQYHSLQIFQQLQNNQAQNPKKYIDSHCPFPELANRLWQYLCYKYRVSQKSWASLSTKSLETFAQNLSKDKHPIVAKGAFKDEFVTCGGVALNEINFKNMESKLCPGLHIVGELLNIDGITGGFNFQNAWTTGYLAAGE